MRFFGFLTVFLTFLVVSGPVQARSWWEYFFTPPLDPVERPYLEDGKTPHLSIYEHDTWTPQDWISSRGSASEVLDDLYKSGVITDQYERGGTPVLEVGPNFMKLSGQDKRRVAAFVDHMFRITDSNASGMFHLYDQKTCDPIGLYAQNGLQLQ